MEQKRKSSTLRPLPKEDDVTTDITRLKRRISFSEKKSIRVFCAEEEPKAWDISYELSDRGEQSSNTYEHNTNTSENQTQSSSGLCTTNEFIDKTYHNDFCIENSLGITMSELEKKRHKNQKSTNSVAKIVSEMSSNTTKKPNDEIITNKPTIKTNENENNDIQMQHHNPQQPNHNSASTNFVYLNENSNKENIAPEIIEVNDTKNKKVNKGSQPVEQNAKDLDTSDGSNITHMKHSTSQRHTTTVSNQKQSSNKVGISKVNDALQNMSGLCVIDSPISFYRRYSTDDFSSPLIPPDFLPTFSKKISFQQLNEDIANGQLQVFPPTPKCKGLLIHKDLDMVEELAETHAEKSGFKGSVEKNQTLYAHKDIESTFVKNMESTRSRPSLNDPTKYFDIGIESTCMDFPKVSKTKDRRTAYFDDCIEIDDNKIDEKEFVASILKFKNKFQQTKKDTSFMDLTLSSDNDPVETEKAHTNPNKNRHTIYFENEKMETEQGINQQIDDSVHREDVIQLAEVNRKNLYQPKPKLQFLQTTIAEQKELKGTTPEIENPPYSKRYTHHFDNSGFIDIAKNLNEVNTTLNNNDDPENATNIFTANCTIEKSLLEKSDCIIPETEAMEISLEISKTQNNFENIPNKRHTNYFEQNDQIDISITTMNANEANDQIDISITTMNANEAVNSPSSTTKAKEYYMEKAKLLNNFKDKGIECLVDETQRMDFTLESPTNEVVLSNRSTNYFDQLEESIATSAKNESNYSKSIQNIHNPPKENCANKSKCIIPDTQAMELTFESPEQKKNEEIPTKRLTNYFDQNESINITKMNQKETECIIPETQAMDVSFELPTIRNKVVHYFNQNEEMNITHDSNENQKLTNATKTNVMLIEESLDAEKLTEEFKQNKKVSESRQTRYFGFEESLNVTNKIDEVNKTESLIPVIEAAELTNRLQHNIEQNEQINVTKMIHKEIECVISETQDMNVSFESSNLRNEVVDFPINRRTHYFNQDEEISITHNLRENEKNLNATNANVMQIEESCSEQEIYKESVRFQKVPESRKTTYFGYEESLNITKKSEDDYNPLQKTTTSKVMSEKTERNESLKSTESNDVHKKRNLIKDMDENVEPIVCQKRYTHIYNNSDVMNITLHTNKNLESSSYNQTTNKDSVDKMTKFRYTKNFNNTDAMITSIEELSPLKDKENDENIINLNKHACRKTLHFDSDNQMDVTDQANHNEKENQFLSRSYELPMINKSQDMEIILKENVVMTNKANTPMQNIKKSASSDRQKTVLFSSMIDEMEIETTPKNQLKTNRQSCFNDYTTYTPGRSILEFLRFEQEVAEEGEKHVNEYSILNESSKTENTKASRNQKRSTSNLTPNLPNSKKRQSVSCDRVVLKNPKTTFNENLKKAFELEKENSALSYEQDENNVEITKLVDSERSPLLSKDLDINSKLTYQPITPRRSELRKSRIPTYTGSAKKKNFALNLSGNSKSIHNLDFSLQTVDLARFCNESHTSENYISTPSEPVGNITKELSLSKKDPIRKSIFDLGDQPIVISDVSEHYLSLKQKLNSSLQNNSNKIIKKNDQLLESLLEVIDNDDIDKTKLKLVETLLDETEEEEIQERNLEENVIQLLETSPDTDRGIDKNSSKFHSSSAEIENCKKGNSLVCRNCKCCKDILLNVTTSSGQNESFIMPEMPSLEDLMGKFNEAMDKITRGPTLDVAFEFAERIMLQRAAEISDTSTDGEDDDYEDSFIKECKERSAQIERNLQSRFMKPAKVRKPFIGRLKDLLNDENSRNWIMNAEMMQSQIIMFSHKHMYTNRISLKYEKKDPFGDDIKITNISLEDSSSPKKIWTPFDFITHFQLQLELPSNLRSYCTGDSESDIYEMLRELDQIFRNNVKMCRELWRVVCENFGSLIRENGQTLIRKVMRKIIRSSTGLYLTTECQEIRIGVTNIKKLCYKDITMPPVYMFREEIETIPAGLDFLHIFLKNPAEFFKNVDNQ